MPQPRNAAARFYSALRLTSPFNGTLAQCLKPRGHTPSCLEHVENSTRQPPMLVLMIGYAMISLRILSQRIVEYTPP